MPEFIMSDRSTLPSVPRSHAVRSGNLVFVSVTPNPPDRKVAIGDFTAQMTQCMENLKIILEDAGTSMASVVKVNVLLARVREDVAAMNEVYGAYFPDGNYPTRTTCGVTLPNPNFLLEIECVAEV